MTVALIYRPSWEEELLAQLSVDTVKSKSLEPSLLTTVDHHSDSATKEMPRADIEGQHYVDVDHVEAPVTFKAYMACAFAAFGGIFFGYGKWLCSAAELISDMGYIAGVMGMNYVITHYTGLPIPGPNATQAEKDAFVLPSWMQSLITSILSAGTFFGALIAGDMADIFGRRTTIIAGCGIFIVGTILQVASTGYKLLVAGRAIAGIGVGFESAVVILYMSEIAPRKVRGALVSGYQFCITIGILVSHSLGAANFAACILCKLRQPEPDGHWFLPHSHRPPGMSLCNLLLTTVCLGVHSCLWSLLAPRVSSLLCQTWTYRSCPRCPHSHPWTA